MTTNAAARNVIGYLMVRGEVRQAAYALALRKITGVEVTKMLPTPNIDDALIPEARKWQETGSNRKLYTFSEEHSGMCRRSVRSVRLADGNFWKSSRVVPVCRRGTP